MPTLKEINAKLGPGGSRRGMCNSPHPDQRYREYARVPHPEGLQTRNEVTGKLETVYVDAEAPTVTCSRFEGHEGDCAAFAFLISKPDTWPNPDAR